MDEDAFNTTVEEFFEQESNFDFWYYFDQFLIFTTGLISVILNGSLIFSIFKFKGMRNRLNILIGNVCILNILQYLSDIQSILIFDMIFDVYSYTFNLYCYIYDLHLYFFAISSMFIFMISLETVFVKIGKKTFKYLNLSVWLLLIVCTIINTLQCIGHSMMFPIYTIIFCAICFFFTTIRYFIYIKDLIKKNVNKDYHHRLTIVGVYLIMKILNIVIEIVLAIVYMHSFSGLFILILNQLNYSQPIIFVLILLKYDDNFKMCLKNLYDCKYHFIEASINYKKGLDDEVNLTEEDNCLNTNISDII